MTRRSLILLLLAVAAVALIPVAFSAGAAYAVESQVWDAANRTYLYVERPGAGLALIATFITCVGLALAAIVALILAVRARRSSPAAMG